MDVLTSLIARPGQAAAVVRLREGVREPDRPAADCPLSTLDDFLTDVESLKSTVYGVHVLLSQLAIQGTFARCEGCSPTLVRPQRGSVR